MGHSVVAANGAPKNPQQTTAVNSMQHTYYVFFLVTDNFSFNNSSLLGVGQRVSSICLFFFLCNLQNLFQRPPKSMGESWFGKIVILKATY